MARFRDTLLRLLGSSSGETVLKSAATASGTLTLPAGTTDFSATGGANLFVGQAGVGAAFTVTKPTTAITAAATNSNAAAGELGEYIESDVPTASGVALTSGVSANVTSISLTAGDWDVAGNIFFNNPGQSITAATTAINNVSATFPAGELWTQLSGFTTTVGLGFALWPRRFSLASTTTIYLLANVGYTGAGVTGSGILRARRVR